LLREKYFMDHAALGLVGATSGPLARFVDWTNTYVIDGIVNAVGGATKLLGDLVYNGLDQLGVDGVFNGLSAAADSAGSALRKIQTGRVQQYASGFVAGALILIVLFVFVI
jgi:NADH:ubiquinone oxidoreductase subunit 5 (subunit L)/multisubunit Na+/H+ antiporter MnhA subunit